MTVMWKGSKQCRRHHSRSFMVMRLCSPSQYGAARVSLQPQMSNHCSTAERRVQRCEPTGVGRNSPERANRPSTTATHVAADLDLLINCKLFWHQCGHAFMGVVAERLRTCGWQHQGQGNCRASQCCTRQTAPASCSNHNYSTDMSSRTPRGSVHSHRQAQCPLLHPGKAHAPGMDRTSRLWADRAGQR